MRKLAAILLIVTLSFSCNIQSGPGAKFIGHWVMAKDSPNRAELEASPSNKELTELTFDIKKDGLFYIVDVHYPPNHDISKNFDEMHKKDGYVSEDFKINPLICQLSPDNSALIPTNRLVRGDIGWGFVYNSDNKSIIFGHFGYYVKD